MQGYRPIGNRTSEQSTPHNCGSSIMSYTETVFRQIVKKDDEHTRQVIKDYVRQKYPKKNVRIDFLDEEVVNRIIDLGIREYLKEMRDK